ncbi:hypothetical protein [Streptomyces sp. CAU 1734]|uniref:hypothetical protein n=1 Tax=Streptomyces sp. CAU 1734 TaxID=3140360 RepID=UPI003261022A
MSQSRPDAPREPAPADSSGVRTAGPVLPPEEDGVPGTDGLGEPAEPPGPALSPDAPAAAVQYPARTAAAPAAHQVAPLSLGIGLALMGLGIGFLGVRLRGR